MTFIRRLLSLIFLVISFTCLAYFGKEVYEILRLQDAGDAEKLYILWERDLQTLQEQNKLHPGWSQIREVVLIGGTPTTKKWLKEIGSPVRINPKGDHRLEVLVLNWTDEGREGAVVQYNLVNLKTGNMIWELGRTFTLKEAPTLQAKDKTSIEEATAPSSAPEPSAPASVSDKPSEAPSASPAESNSH